MWDSIQKLRYRARAGIDGAKTELETRLQDRLALPLTGIGGETLYLTGISALRARAAGLRQLYDRLPEHRGYTDSIVLDAYSSATIEGARTTVASVRQSFSDPRTKDDRMVINTVRGCQYAYGRPITEKNLRRLWDRVVDGVCENPQHRGTLYRTGMVYVGSPARTVHTPAAPEAIPAMMGQWFAFLEEDATEPLLRSFAAHFYFVYVHPFCDGNGRTARILNASQLYHGGWKKMRSLPLSSAVNKQLSGYYSSLSDAEAVLNGQGERWLDLSPFVSYMLDAFEQCLADASLARNTLTQRESRLLDRMNRAGPHSEITAKKAAAVLDAEPASARAVLNRLCEKGYLSVNTEAVPYVYRLDPQFLLD